MDTPRREGSVPALLAGLLLAFVLTFAPSVSAADTGHVAAGWVLRIAVPEAVGGKTVIGQLTVDRATDQGFVTAYGCDDGLPRADGGITRSDVNYDGGITPVASNRLIVEADDDGDVCLYTSATVDMIVDLNAVSFDTGMTSFPNRRTDTRGGPQPAITAGDVLRVRIPEAVGGKTVIGQLTVDRATDQGFVTAYGCDDGLPRADGGITRSDVNYDGGITPVASNRLIVEADDDGDVCLYTSATVDMIVDLNATAGVGIFSFPNRRTDTRSGTDGVTIAPPGGADAPVWPPYEPAPTLAGVAALTGEPADAEVTGRPILAAKIDNFRLARPQWALNRADAIIEVNVEGVTRFIALFHSQLPAELGPVRSARTGDLDLLAAMNRPVFAYSGANPGVTAWVRSAASSGVLIDFSAMSKPCYRRDAARPGPHNLLIDPGCAVDAATTAGPARPLWTIDPAWTAPAGAAGVADTTFSVRMDGVDVGWTWDTATGTYLRTQDGAPHFAVSGEQIKANNVVEISALHARSPVDERSPHPITVGAGDAVVHRNGLAIAGTWARPTAYDAFTFIDRATGMVIPLDLGATFVEVVRAS